MLESWLAQIFTVIARTPHITYQILTKRPERMRDYMRVAGVATRTKHSLSMEPFPNVWLGVTVENQAMANKRIPILLDTPAAVRFVSVEPMLGRVDIAPWIGTHNCHHCYSIGSISAAGERFFDENCQSTEDGILICPRCGKPGGVGTWDSWMGRAFDGPGLDWVISGGEMGPKARPMHPDWAQGLRDQCQAANMPFFFKKWGAYKGENDWNIPGGELIGGQIVREFPTQKGGNVDEN